MTLPDLSTALAVGRSGVLSYLSASAPLAAKIAVHLPLGFARSAPPLYRNGAMHETNTR